MPLLTDWESYFLHDFHGIFFLHLFTVFPTAVSSYQIVMSLDCEYLSYDLIIFISLHQT